MQWIHVKEKLPEPGQIVLIQNKYRNPFISVARYTDNLCTLHKDYEHVFVVIRHPKTPKEWLFDERYQKISYLEKNKVEKWCAIEL